jgi:hypothetical protein
MDAKTTEHGTSPLRAGYNSLVPDTEYPLSSLAGSSLASHTDLLVEREKQPSWLWQQIRRLFNH